MEARVATFVTHYTVEIRSRVAFKARKFLFLEEIYVGNIIEVPLPITRSLCISITNTSFEKIKASRFECYTTYDLNFTYMLVHSLICTLSLKGGQEVEGVTIKSKGEAHAVRFSIKQQNEEPIKLGLLNRQLSFSTYLTNGWNHQGVELGKFEWK